jgi:Ca2+-dependent lipid-binding protein
MDTGDQAVSPLEVTVIQASNLFNLEKFGKIDPYVAVEYQGKKLITQVSTNHPSGH